MLATPPRSVALEVHAASMSEVICETCGERKELDAVDDGFCCWCRSREKEISEIQHRWGFDKWGRPLGGAWDGGAQWRDAQAKLEIDAQLEQLGLKARWVEMWWGFGTVEHRPIRRGQIQAFSVAEAVNRKWGFDGEGDPVGESWDHETQRRAGLALEEVKRILWQVGLALPDEWPDEWSPDRAYALNPLEISECVWPPGFGRDQVSACNKCGEEKQLVYAGSVCARCADTLE
jgi:hypothetical protein